MDSIRQPADHFGVDKRFELPAVTLAGTQLELDAFVMPKTPGNLTQ